MNLTEHVLYVLAIILNMVPFSFFRYYPFRKSLRISVCSLLFLYSLVLLSQVMVYLYYYDVLHGEAFFVRYSWYYIGFILTYLLLALLVIRVSIFKQLYLWFTLALWEMAVFGVGIWVEISWQAYFMVPRFLLLDLTVLILLVLTIPPSWHFLQRMEPFLRLDRPKMWRWSWLPSAMFLMIATFYSLEVVHHFNGMVFCRLLSFSAACLNLWLLLQSFELQHQQNVFRQKLQMAQELARLQEDTTRAAQQDAFHTREIYGNLQRILNALKDCAGHRDQQRALDTITKEKKNLHLSSTVQQFCKQELLDSILRYSEAEAVREGIRTEIKVRLDKNLLLDDIDLCALFGNLLENAIAGCRTLPQNRRWLTLHISRVGDMTIITLDNSCAAESVHCQGNVFFSSKRAYREAGIGVGSICDIVAKYQGEIEIGPRNGMFSVSILLQDASVESVRVGDAQLEIYAAK